jgi:hypothetical protein
MTFRRLNGGNFRLVLPLQVSVRGLKKRRTASRGPPSLGLVRLDLDNEVKTHALITAQRSKMCSIMQLQRLGEILGDLTRLSFAWCNCLTLHSFCCGNAMKPRRALDSVGR